MVPTYRRPQDLRRCLRALGDQSVPADEIIVVVRDDDTATWEFLNARGPSDVPIREITVTEPGLVHAMNVGLAATTTDVLAITDDDAAPHRDWIARIIATFAQSAQIGGVGGRDLMHVGGVLKTGRAKTVGKVPLVGRHVGNHHLGFGVAREVDTLKGVNNAYRTQALKAIGFDTRLRGSGAQIYWEMSLGLAMRRAGWKLIYDPNILVDHYLAQRIDEDQREGFNALALQNAAYNDGVVRMERLPVPARLAYLCWAFLVGTRFLPGAVQVVRFFPAQRMLVISKMIAAVCGRLDAWRFLVGQTS
jgi:cellulose synthase/poly-beta-1,6-N-acetylglucosamine synthase-like glycosyltransferase